jgi:hypothetical protein
MDNFRSRVDRIANGSQKGKRAIRRDRLGVIVMPKAKQERFKWMMIVRPLILLYISFAVFKAVLIYNSDQNDYAQVIANLEAGDSKSKIVAYTMSPGYFTKPLGVFVSNVANHINEAQTK